ncbi:HAAS domain-containing protein [Brevibacillus sp. VP]|uniref:HAAS domain-containing protein n=1 Tax=unclassified Brevibacillus TaxID=2684853 RepID=UPI000E2F8E88|nr:hypothetical protein [Brevibacillus sp. VP]RFB33015.1 hypothetical protein DZB91_14535 [Brevibacillus sp. VP]
MGYEIRGELEYSLLDLIGYPFIFIFSLSLAMVLFKYVASNKTSKIQGWLIVSILVITPMILSFLLIYLNNYYKASVIQFGAVGNVIAIVVSSLVCIGIAIWSKAW